MSTIHCILVPIDQEPFYLLPFVVLNVGGKITLRYESDQQQLRAVACYEIDTFRMPS
jgi:hypothetical protein